MTLLTKDQILGAPRKDFEDVDCPEFGGLVRVRGLNAFEHIEYEERCVAKDYANMRAMLVAACAIDEAGKPLFTEDDAEQLGKAMAKPIDRLFLAIMRQSKFTDADVEKLEKNSESGQS